MLTDYHTHLRPDEPGTNASEYFTERNVERYLLAAEQAGVAELGFSEHVHRFAQALEVWDHPFWCENAIDDLDAYVQFVVDMKQAGYPIKLGLELDYLPGRERQLRELLGNRPWDYVIGSVHFIADRAVDQDAYDAWRSNEPDEVWREYFETLAQAAASGLFDILAHPDLVKVWGAGRPAPQRPLTEFYELAVPAIIESGAAVELSTAGLRKPVGEIYPSRGLLDPLVAGGCAVALSSDAHVPEQIGFEYDRAVEYLHESGVREICVFDQRSRRMEELG